jgi:hypothetical protein
LESQPYKRYRLSAKRVNPALLERIAKVLIREESQRVEIEVSDDFRSDLRRRLEIENRRKQEELARAYAEIEAEKLVALEAKPSYRAKKALQEKGRELEVKLRGGLSDLYSRLQKYKNRKPPGRCFGRTTLPALPQHPLPQPDLDCHLSMNFIARHGLR